MGFLFSEMLLINIYGIMGPFEKLVSNIEQLQDLGYKTELNIEPFLMKEEEVAKLLIKTAQPNLTDEQVSFMVESPAKLKKKIDKNLSPEEKKKKREQIDEAHRILKDYKKNKIKEAKDKKDEIKTAVFDLVREIKDLIKK
jgi:DNA repair photolyase